MPASVEFVLGVDIGTSSCKAVAFGLDGHRLAAASSPYPTLDDENGGVRQDPESWWKAAQIAIAEALKLAPDGALIGIGFSGQIGTHALLDDDYRPLANAWTWQDGSAASSFDFLNARIDAPTLATELRTWLPAGAAWPLPRLLWLRQSQPRIFDRARVIAQPKDIVIHRLTGVFVSDASSWRGVVSPAGEVHGRSLELLGLPDILPPIAGPTSVAGPVLPTIGRRLGIPDNTPVFVGWNDFNCALVGTGVAEEGDAFDIAGTSEHIGVLSQQAVTDGSINSVPFSAGSNSGAYVNYGVSSNGGSVAAWLGTTYLTDTPNTSARNEKISALAGKIAAGSDGLLFLPYLNGERSPVWDVSASGAYTGIRSQHGLGHLMRAALEGVAFNLREIRNSSPNTPDHLRVIHASGGPVGMSLWNSIKSSVLDTPLAIMRERNSGALGAGILAAVGAGAFATTVDGMREMTRIDHTVEPDPHLVDAYDHAFSRYSAIYPALTQHKIASLRSSTNVN